jgi:hypothetical protein
MELSCTSVFTFNEHVQPICLWNFDFQPLVTKAIVIGYGKSEDRSKTHETTPKELEAKITSNEYCVFREPEVAQISSPRTFCFGDDQGSVPCKGKNLKKLL